MIRLKDRQLHQWAKQIADGNELCKFVRLNIAHHSNPLTIRGIPIEISTYGSVPIRTDKEFKYHIVFIRKRPVAIEDAFVLGHEFQHLVQLEETGSAEEFITAYQHQQETVGYLDNCYEKDADRAGLKWAQALCNTGPLRLISRGYCEIEEII